MYFIGVSENHRKNYVGCLHAQHCVCTCFTLCSLLWRNIHAAAGCYWTPGRGRVCVTLLTSVVGLGLMLSGCSRPAFKSILLVPALHIPSPLDHGDSICCLPAPVDSSWAGAPHCTVPSFLMFFWCQFFSQVRSSWAWIVGAIP